MPTVVRMPRGGDPEVAMRQRISYFSLANLTQTSIILDHPSPIHNPHNMAQIFTLTPPAAAVEEFISACRNIGLYLTLDVSQPRPVEMTIEVDLRQANLLMAALWLIPSVESQVVTFASFRNPNCGASALEAIMDALGRAKKVLHHVESNKKRSGIFGNREHDLMNLQAPLRWLEREISSRNETGEADWYSACGWIRYRDLDDVLHTSLDAAIAVLMALAADYNAGKFDINRSDSEKTTRLLEKGGDERLKKTGLSTILAADMISNDLLQELGGQQAMPLLFAWLESLIFQSAPSYRHGKTKER